MCRLFTELKGVAVSLQMIVHLDMQYITHTFSCIFHIMLKMWHHLKYVSTRNNNWGMYMNVLHIYSERTNEMHRQWST